MTIADTTYREFNVKRAPTQHEGADAELEAHIDRAGRDEVLAMASAGGWSSANVPPKWVWRQMADEVLRRKQQTA